MRFRKYEDSYRGIYVIQLALVLGIMIAFCALLIGGGLLLVNRERLQNYTNTIALAALEAYTRKGMDGKASEAQKTAAAVTRANQIFGAGSLYGTVGLLGGLTVTSGDDEGINFGTYWPEKEGCHDCDTRCTRGYPCFIPRDSKEDPPNAVRVKVTLTDDNRLELPFLRYLGTDFFKLSATSVARIRERCVVFALANDLTTAAISHKASSDGDDKGLYAFPDAVTDGTSDKNTLCNPGDGGGCNKACDNLAEIWCSMGDERAHPTSKKRVFDHYRSDYTLEEVAFGNEVKKIWVDGYSEPEPLRSILLSAHTALKVMSQQATPGDRAALLAFNDQVVDTVPKKIDSNDLEVFTRNLPRLIELTNFNRGPRVNQNGVVIKDPSFPNFIDRQWLPAALGYSNIEAALSKSIAMLSDPLSCPATADKIIVLFTTRKMRCAQVMDTSKNWSDFDSGQPVRCGSLEVPYSQSISYNDDKYRSSYLGVEKQLIGEIDAPLDDFLLGLMLENHIRLTTVLTDLDGVANTLNVINPLTGMYHDFTSAAAAGYGHGLQGGGGLAQSKPFFDMTSVGTSSDLCLAKTTEQQAFECEGQQGISDSEPATFSRSAALLLGMSMITGGEPCPLQPICMTSSTDLCLKTEEDDCKSTNCYDKDGNLLDECRSGENKPQRCALRNLSIGDQVIHCIVSAVAGNPYSLGRAKLGRSVGIEERSS